jgi:hypothetical protein
VIENVDIILQCHFKVVSKMLVYDLYYRQYSFYVVNVCGVRPILTRLGYQPRIDALNVVHIKMNHFL